MQVANWLCGQQLREKLVVWGDFIRKSGAFVTGITLAVVDLKLDTFLFKFRHAQAALMVSSETTGESPGLPFWLPAYLERVEKHHRILRRT
jgi:hypothetical protein